MIRRQNFCLLRMYYVTFRVNEPDSSDLLTISTFTPGDLRHLRGASKGKLGQLCLQANIYIISQGPKPCFLENLLSFHYPHTSLVEHCNVFTVHLLDHFLLISMSQATEEFVCQVFEVRFRFYQSAVDVAVPYHTRGKSLQH